MKMNDEQQRIIDCLNKNMIVSASAGSGKTFVLIQKIISILLSNDKDVHASLDQMLILTFTNQAASEMSVRLENELIRLSENNEKIIDELDCLKVADISTFHAFCQKMLKRYFFQANISADFSLCDEQKQTVLFEKGIKKALSLFKKTNSQRYLSLMEMFSSSRSDKEIIGMIFDINNYMSNVQNEKEWIKEFAQKLYGEQGRDFVTTALNNKLIKTCAFFSKKLYEQIGKLNGVEYDKIRAHILEFYNELQKINIQKSFRDNYDCLFAEEHSRFVQKEKDEFIIDALKERDEYKEYKKSLKKYNFADRENEIELEQISAQAISDLIEIYLNAKQVYARLKQNEHLLDFCDLEQKFCEVLGNEKIRKEISSNYKYVFVDEFQDTNEVQENILNKLGESIIMVVGDMKQSIYGFRGSKPKIFSAILKDYQSGHGGVAQTLNCNYRSSPDVLNFANLIFSKIMTMDTSGVDYFSGSMFIPKAEYPKEEDESVKICIVRQKPETEKKPAIELYDLSKDDGDEDTTNARNEARVVAENILNAKGKKIYDKDLNCYRETIFSDMTILLRSRTNIDAFCDELFNAGVPVIASGKKLLSEFPEIITITNILKLLISNQNDVALASGLSSYFCGLSYDQLANIRTTYSDLKYYYECVEKYRNEYSDLISEKINNFINTTIFLKNKLNTENVFEVLYYLIEESGYKDNCSLQPNGFAKASRLMELERLAETMKDWDIDDVVSYLDNSDNGPKAPNLTSGDVDCVNIMTIHASKGLEFPIVFLVDCGQDFGSRSQKSKLEFHSDFGFALNLFDNDEKIEYDSVQKLYLKQEKQREEFAEALRLLYVAVTRAKNKLFISGCSKFDGFSAIKNDYQVLEQKKYIDLIIGSLKEECIDKIKLGLKVREVSNNQNFLIECYEPNCEIEELKNSEVPTFSKPDKAFVDELSKYLGFVYPYNNSTNLALKSSVSSLAFEDVDYQSINSEPQRLDVAEHNPAVGADTLGTIYHLLLEKIDFNNANSVQAIKDFAYGILDEDTRELIDYNNVFKIIKLIKPFLGETVYKEKEFIMQLRQDELVEGGEKDMVIVQGKIDIFTMGNKNILFDYKLTRINDELILKNKYQKQMDLYRLAIEKSFKQRVSECYIADINHARLIKMC